MLKEERIILKQLKEK